MRYHFFQKFFGKMVKVKEISFLSTRGMGLMFGNCIIETLLYGHWPAVSKCVPPPERLEM